MSDSLSVRREFFTTSSDQEANRELVLRISEQIVERVRPGENVFTENVFDTLLDMALHDQIAQAGNVKLGFGGAELLMMVLVPVVTSALTAAFVSARVAGIRGITALPELQSVVTRGQIEQVIRKSNVRVSRTELDLIVTLLHQEFSEGFQEAAEVGNIPNNRCCGFDCGDVYERMAAAFSLHELRDLCASLGVRHEECILEGVPLSANAQNLGEYFLRRGLFCELLQAAKQRREHLDWDTLRPS